MKYKMKNRITLWDRLLIKVLPKLFFRKVAAEQGIGSDLPELAEKLFRKAKRIDFQPLSGGQRGLVIFIDQKFSVWFYQDGDHFIYDGFEIGEYDKGEVTVFDNLRHE